MAATKTKRVLLASQANGAGVTTPAAEWNLSTAYGGLLVAKVTNGGTGPTIGCDVVVYVGGATGEKYEFSRQTAPTGSGAVTTFVVEVPAGAMFVNLDFAGNTGQAVTVEAHGEELTTI